MQPRKLLMVAATGGHLTQLIRLAPRFGTSERSVWVTFDTEQSRSMLADKETLYVPYISPRDWKGTIGAFRKISKYLKGHDFEGVYSTGAAVALAAFLQPKLRKTQKTYIESVSRTEGPSLTGRLVSLLPSVTLYTQHKMWANKKWNHMESVLAQYSTLEHTEPRGSTPNLFITLGTIRPYRFDALVDAVLATGLAGPGTVWQLGVTDRQDLPGKVHDQMEADEFVSAAKDADVVITHAGVGTVIQLLELGKCPVVVPREKERGEHVDNHQFQISELLVKQGLGVVVRANALSAREIELAENYRTETHG